MNGTVPDLLWTRLVTLTGCLEATLSHYEAPTCRVFVAPGGPPAWDVCCDCHEGEGQAWVQVDRVYATDNFPAEQTGANRCRPAEFAAVIRMGVLRCAATVDDQAEIPSADRLIADAWKVQRDRVAMYDALTCCFLDDADPGTYVVGPWTPLGPAGGCVGGTIEFTLQFPNCACPKPHAGFGLGGFGVQPFGS